MAGIAVNGPAVEREDEVLTTEALDFVAQLQVRFGERLNQLLAARRARRTTSRAPERSTSCRRRHPSAMASGPSTPCLRSSSTAAWRSPVPRTARWRSTP